MAFWKTSFLQNKNWLCVQNFMYNISRLVKIFLLLSAIKEEFFQSFFWLNFNVYINVHKREKARARNKKNKTETILLEEKHENFIMVVRKYASGHQGKNERQWKTKLISQFFCNLNSSKKSTRPSGKLITEFTGPIAKSTSPGLLDATFFARCYIYLKTWNLSDSPVIILITSMQWCTVN